MSAGSKSNLEPLFPVICVYIHVDLFRIRAHVFYTLNVIIATPPGKFPQKSQIHPPGQADASGVISYPPEHLHGSWWFVRMTCHDEWWWWWCIHHDESWCFIMMTHHDASSWFIMMTHHDSSWWIIMIHRDESSWFIRMNHDDSSWLIMMNHHDESSWFIMMNHHDSSW